MLEREIWQKKIICRNEKSAGFSFDPSVDMVFENSMNSRNQLLLYCQFRNHNFFDFCFSEERMFVIPLHILADRSVRRSLIVRLFSLTQIKKFFYCSFYWIEENGFPQFNGFETFPNIQVLKQNHRMDFIPFS